ncbi:hypothetical protein [Acidiphilium acidophilum]|uniref:hypothetical protein n=1 Tax=Acidiphilium acidophilum TaxID=76588 RepID=UPI002E8E6F48|nr:hypothetical protein [Acidiphilium acidophilum]
MRIASLKLIVAELREENARLKGLKGRPHIKPNGMEKGTAPPKPQKQEKRPRSGQGLTPGQSRRKGDRD